MKHFLLKLLLFVAPVVLFSALPLYLQLESREDFYNLDRFFEKERKTSLVGYAYNEENYRYFKYKSILENEPVEVMAIGSSRVLQFRQEMFSASFYNAGYVIETIADIDMFLSILPQDRLPLYLIIGLDQWMFNPDKDRILRPHPPSWWQNNLSTNYKKSVQNFLRIYRDVWRGKINPLTLGQKNEKIYKIGLYAHLDSSGFRNDGSFFYGRQIQKLEQGDSTASDHNFAETLRRVEKGIIGFEHGDHINERAFVLLEQLLSFCEHNSINVICFMPPFADVVYERMLSNHNHAYLSLIEPKIRYIQRLHQFEFYAYHHAPACGSSDDEFIDGRHGSEKAYLRILLDMLKNCSELNNATNPMELQKALSGSNSRYTIFSRY
mgnify:CR=1 FL=1